MVLSLWSWFSVGYVMFFGGFISLKGGFSEIDTMTPLSTENAVSGVWVNMP